MSEHVIEIGHQAPPNAVYLRVRGDEIRVTVNPQPEPPRIRVTPRAAEVTPSDVTNASDEAAPVD